MAVNAQRDIPHRNVLKDAVIKIRPVFLWATVLSAGINILLLTTPLFMMQIFDRVMSSRREETLLLLLLMALISFVFWGALDWVRGRLMAKAVEWWTGQLESETVRISLQTNLSGSNSGAQGVRDLQTIGNYFCGRAAMAFFDAPWAIVFFIVLWLIHPAFGIFALVSMMIILSLTVAGEFMSRRTQTNAQSLQLASQRWLDAAVTQSEAVCALGMRENLLARHQREAGAARQANDGATRWLESTGSATRTFRQMAQAGIMAFGAWLMLLGSVSPGAVIASAILLARALAPVDQLSGTWKQFMLTRSAWQRLTLLYTQKRPGCDTTALPTPHEKIVITQASVRVPNATAVSWLLRDISLTLKRGGALAVVGASGAGKTTLCRMLAGIVKPEHGEIRLDGARLDQWEPDELGHHIGYLPQDVGLPPATVAETISRLALNVDAEKVHAAAQKAGAHELILSLPQGYDTPIGAGGLPLSGGQKQRIGLARALFGDPLLVILDEPDAHLDPSGEKALQLAIHEIRKSGAMVVITAHRSSMLNCVQDLLVLEGGHMKHLGPKDAVLQALHGGKVDTIVRAKQKAAQEER